MSMLLYFIFKNVGLIFSLAAFSMVFYYIYLSSMKMWKKYFFLISYCVIYGGMPFFLKSLGLYHSVHIFDDLNKIF